MNAIGVSLSDLSLTGIKQEVPFMSQRLRYHQFLSLYNLMKSINIHLVEMAMSALRNVETIRTMFPSDPAFYQAIELYLGIIELELSPKDAQAVNDFDAVIKRIASIRSGLAWKGVQTTMTVHAEMVELNRLIVEQLDGKMFMHVPRDCADIYNNTAHYLLIYGVEPKVDYHVAEAGKCLALDRSTACVMHLCVAVEIFARYLQEKAKFTTVLDSDSAGTIVGKAIKEIEPWANDHKKKQHNQLFSDLQGFFRGTRNLAMHGLQKDERFSEAEAKSLFGSTESLLIHLVQLIKDFYP